MKLNSILQFLGLGLLVCSLALLAGSKVSESRAKEMAAEVIGEIEALLPERTEGSVEEYTNLSMPVLQIDGQNFSGILEVPAFGVTLPIADAWDSSKIRSYPCRFFGSVYDGSLVVGGADQSGQFDFCSKIDQGAYISVTDMTGAEFEYTVTRIDRSKSADAETLISEKDDLILFVRDRYALNYILVRCSAGKNF